MLGKKTIKVAGRTKWITILEIIQYTLYTHSWMEMKIAIVDQTLHCNLFPSKALGQQWHTNETLLTVHSVSTK